MRLSVGETLVSSIGPPLAQQQQTGSGATLTTFQLVSTQSGLLPFRIAMPLVNGVNSATSLTTTADSSQVVIKKKYNNNSNKHVIIDGHATLVANTLKTFALVDTSATGTNLTSANITAANPSASIVFSGGVVGTVSLNSLLGSPTRTWVSGPEAVECHYSTTLGNLFIAYHVRLYKNGRIFVRAIVENGWVDLTNTDKTYTPVITIGGVVVYNPGSITHFQNTRYFAEGWIGGNPAVTPKHNMVDIIATKMVPNYFMDTPPAAALNSLIQTYTPLNNGGWTPSMGDTGPQNQIGLLPLWDALCITSLGDSRGYNACISGSRALNSYPIVWRGSTDSNLPVRPSIFPTRGMDGFQGSDGKGTPTLFWEVNHHGSGGYLAYLLSGEYVDLETAQLQSATCYLCPDFGAFGQGVNRYLGRQIRGHGWMERTIGQMCAITPANDPILTDYQTLLTNTAAADIAAKNAVGYPTIGMTYSFNNGGGGWNTPDGSSFNGTIPPWMQDFVVSATGMNSDIEYGTTTQMSTWTNIRDFLYTWPVSRLGTGDPTPGTGSYCYSIAAQYGIQVSNAVPGDDVIPNWYAKDWGTLFASAVNKPPGFTTCTNVLQGTSGADPATGATSYWANLLPAIAYAVDHNKTGAQTSWNRLTGTSNWLTLRNAVAPNDFASFPNFAIQPRNSQSDALISLLATMPAGTWTAVPRATGTRLSDVVYGQNPGDSATLATAILGQTGPTSIITVWGGAALDTTNKQLFICSGGHGDYHGNEAYTFDYTTLRWKNISKPTDPSLVDVNLQFMADGTPAIPHTYGDPTWDPIQNRVMYLGAGIWTGGGTNAVYTINKGTMQAGVTAGTTGTNSWLRRADWQGNLGGNTQSNMDFDPVSGHCWAWGLFTHTIAEYVPGTNSWINHLDPSGNSPTDIIFPSGNNHPNGFGCIQPGLRAVTTGDTLTYEISIAPATAGKVLQWATTGDKTAENGNAPGMQWYSNSSLFVAWNGGTTVYSIDPNTKVWIAHTASPLNGLAANIPTAPAPNGTFNRFRFLPWANCFSVVNDYNQDVYIYKPNF